MSLQVTGSFIWSPELSGGADDQLFIMDKRGQRSGSSAASAFFLENYPGSSYQGNLIQGGAGNATCGSGGVRINFPVAFQYRCIAVSVQYYDYFTDWDSTFGNSNPTPTMCGANSDASGFQLYQAVSVNSGVGNVPGTFGYSYIAFGV